MSKKGNAKNLFGKRRRSQIEINEEEEKIDTSNKKEKMRNITISVNQNIDEENSEDQAQ